MIASQLIFASYVNVVYIYTYIYIDLEIKPLIYVRIYVRVYVRPYAYTLIYTDIRCIWHGTGEIARSNINSKCAGTVNVAEFVAEHTCACIMIMITISIQMHDHDQNKGIEGDNGRRTNVELWL